MVVNNQNSQWPHLILRATNYLQATTLLQQGAGTVAISIIRYWCAAVFLGRKSTARIHSGLYYIVANRVTNKFAYRMAFQAPHDIRAVGFGGLHAQAECNGHFLAALPFRQQLHNFALPRREPRC